MACAAAAVAALAAGAAVVVARGRMAAVVALGASVGMLLGAGAAAGLHGLQGHAQQESAARYTLRLVEDARTGEWGDSAFAQTRLSTGETAVVQVNLPAGSGLACWDMITGAGSLRLPDERSRSYYWSLGAVGSVKLTSFERVEDASPVAQVGRFRARCLSLFDAEEGDGAALAKAVMYGARADLFSRPVYGDVKSTGLAHIVAVSGAHLAILVAFVGGLLRAGRAPKGIAVALVVLFAAVYVVFAGAPKSAIRAAIMATCALVSFFAQRRSDSLSALGVCAVVLLALDPSIAVSISFALSASATLGIVLFARSFADWGHAAFGGHARGAADLLGLTFASNVFTTAISVPTFGMLPLVSPLANLVVGPVFGVFCVAGVLATLAGLLAGPVGAVAVHLLCVAGACICEAVHVLAGMPCACVAATGSLPVMMVLSALAAGAWWLLWPKPTMGRAWGAAGTVAALALAVGFVIPLLHGDEVVMLDVGQGDAFVIRSGGHALLCDTGTNDALVLAGLARHDVRALDAVLITHPDDDHCGSLAALLDAMPVGRIVVARDLLSDEGENCARLRGVMAGEDVVGVAAGDRLELGDFVVDVVAPTSYQDHGGNADSIVMTVSCDVDHDGASDWRALFTGDAELEVIGPLAQAGAVGRINVLKQPHHGSSGGVDDELLDLLGPQLSLISAGEGNRYGHPTQDTLDVLAAHGVTVARTDLSGDVVCSLRPDGMRVTTQR